MEKLVKGDVVIVNFPFTDLKGFSKRPALVLATLRGDDIILCQITTQQSRFDEYALTLEEVDFNNGKLIHPSYIRVNKVFTASKRIILNKVGKIKTDKLLETHQKLFEIIESK